MRDLRKYSRQTNGRLIVGGLLLLFLVGDGLIYLIWGPGAALSGLICIGAGLVPVIATFFAILILDWIVNRTNKL